ncbi:hypothetical protein NDU88_000770 [Pleurodeles waltl]|uniref:Uncharacterized protein n=1 Tax=Pleurodeles waltl TaxID=8319 RepID=A0AAV7UU19_PLEWA|nr:hypothetical protein NDU88_000770 [Pleurodeles waltl]
MPRTQTQLVLALPLVPRILMLRKPIRNSIRRQRRDLEELKGEPRWRVLGATEERKDAALETERNGVTLREQEEAEEASSGTAISAS